MSYRTTEPLNERLLDLSRVLEGIQGNTLGNSAKLLTPKKSPLGNEHVCMHLGLGAEAS